MNIYCCCMLLSHQYSTKITINSIFSRPSTLIYRKLICSVGEEGFIIHKYIKYFAKELRIQWNTWDWGKIFSSFMHIKMCRQRIKNQMKYVNVVKLYIHWKSRIMFSLDYSWFLCFTFEHCHPLHVVLWRLLFFKWMTKHGHF